MGSATVSQAPVVSISVGIIQPPAIYLALVAWNRQIPQVVNQGWIGPRTPAQVPRAVVVARNPSNLCGGSGGLGGEVGWHSGIGSNLSRGVEGDVVNVEHEHVGNVVMNDSELTGLAIIGAEVEFIKLKYIGSSLVGANLSPVLAVGANINAKYLGCIACILSHSPEAQGATQCDLGRDEPVVGG